MPTTLTYFLATVATLSLVILAGSGAAITYILRQRRSSVPDQALMQERLKVYHELMTHVIKLNRRAVELDDEDTLIDAHERLVLNQESELEPHLDDVTETFHRSYYLLDESVRDATSEYVDYVSSHHDRGLNLGELLSLSGNLVQAMRDDLELPNIFSNEDAH